MTEGTKGFVYPFIVILVLITIVLTMMRYCDIDGEPHVDYKYTAEVVSIETGLTVWTYTTSGNILVLATSDSSAAFKIREYVKDGSYRTRASFFGRDYKATILTEVLEL